jgi:hypothetical protein
MRLPIAFGIILILLLNAVPTPLHAQEELSLQTFTWREAGLIFQYPGGWHAGEYQPHYEMLASNPDALQKALAGEVPGAPTLGFVSYDEIGELQPREVMHLFFPEVTAEEGRLAGTRTLTAEFEDSDNGQMMRVTAFISPVTRKSQLMVAVAPSDQWTSFTPLLESILTTAQFLNGDAIFEFLGIGVTFQFPTEWVQDNNGQVLAAAPRNSQVESVLAGEYSTVPVFVRAQVLVPSGMDLPEGEDTATAILRRFAGDENLAVHTFAWAEGVSAASAEFTSDNQTMLMVAIVEDDKAILVGGGSSSETWATNRAFVLGALDTTQFEGYVAPLNLDELLLGAGEEEAIFGAVIE